MKVAMQFAMPSELHALPGMKGREPSAVISGIPIYELGPQLIAACGGVGKVNAAMCAQILCRHFRCDLILNSGVAGCLTDLPIGSLVLAELGHPAESGRVASGDWFAVKGDRAAWIRDTFRPTLTEMEGGAIAQVCLRNGTRFVALKSVSDHLFSERQAEEYFDFGQALDSLGRVVLPFARRLVEEG